MYTLRVKQSEIIPSHAYAAKVTCDSINRLSTSAAGKSSDVKSRSIIRKGGPEKNSDVMGIMYNIHCTLYCVYGILYNVQYTIYTVQYMIYARPLLTVTRRMAVNKKIRKIRKWQNIRKWRKRIKWRKRRNNVNTTNEMSRIIFWQFVIIYKCHVDLLRMTIIDILMNLLIRPSHLTFY